MTNKCLYCGAELKKGRRGNWYYYCNKKCMDAAAKEFKEALIELCRGKHVCVVTIESKNGSKNIQEVEEKKSRTRGE